MPNITICIYLNDIDFAEYSSNKKEYNRFVKDKLLEKLNS